MANVKERIGALMMGDETAFGAGSASTSYFRVKNVKLPSGREIPTSENYVQQDVMDRPPVFRQPGEVELEMDAYAATGTWPTASPDAPVAGTALCSPANHALRSCLSEPLGSLGYGVADTGCSTTVLKLVGGSLGGTPTACGFKVGDPIFVRTAGADRVLGFNSIKSLDDVAYTITLRSPLPSIPAAGALIMGTWYHAMLTGFDPTSLELTFLGDQDFNKQRNLGCQMSALSLSIPFRGLPVWKGKFKSALPIPPAAAETGGAPGVGAWTWGNASQAIDGGLYLWDGTNNFKIEGGVEVDFGINLVENPGINGVDPNGVDSYTLESRKITVKISPNWALAPNGAKNSLFTLGDSETSDLVFTCWWGRGARAQGFQIPAAVITKYPERANRDGITDLSMELACLAYTGDTGSSGATDGVDKPFVFALLAPEAV